MSTITLSIGYIVVVLMVCVSSTDHLLSETITTIDGPYNFSFSSDNEIMSLEITLKNIPPSVTTILLIYSGHDSFDLRVPAKTLETMRVNKEIKNGEVTISVRRSLGVHQHILIDVELETTEGLCTKSKVAEGRKGSYTSSYWDDTVSKYIYWNTNWTYDSTSSCLTPKNCEIVIDLHNQCEEKISRKYNATKYTGTLHHEKLENSQAHRLNQIYNYSDTIKIVNGPCNFNFSSYNQFMSLEITLKNIPPSVTTIFLIYSGHYSFDLRVPAKTLETMRVDKEIKNGEVTIPFRRSLGYYQHIVIDAELETTEGLCTKSKVAEGRCTSTSYWDNILWKTVYWNTNWTYDSTSSCLTPKNCEIVIDLHNQCEEKIPLRYNATEYTGTLYPEKLENSQPHRWNQIYNYSDTIKIVNGPYNFNFSSYYQLMSLEITLKNIPPSVTTIFLIYSGHYVFDLRVPAETLETIRVDKEVKNGEVTIPFRRSLGNYQHIVIDVELETTEGLCTKSKVAEGRCTSSLSYWDNKLWKYIYWNTDWTYDSTSSCLSPKNCEIGVDFHNQCEVKFSLSCEYNATKCICTLHREIQDYNQRYRLYQSFNNEFFFYVDFFATNIKMIMELESFDNNTSVDVSKWKNENDLVRSNKIILNAKHVVKDKIVGTLNYSESTDIQFSCERYVSPPKIIKVFTVLINSKENKIQALDNAAKLNKHRIKMEANESILCCLYYSFEWTAGGDLQITRVVINKTLLVYQPKEPVSPKVENPANITDLTMPSAQSKDYGWVVYVLAPIIGVSVLILALYFISKRRWLTNSQTVEETVELDNNIRQNEVLYAELDLVKNTNHQTQNQNEESHYATIVGELHPR